DRAAARMLGEHLQLGGGRVVEAARHVGVAADGGVDGPLELLRRAQREPAGVGVHADGEDAVDPDPARGGDDVLVLAGDVVEVGVAVDHFCARGNRGSSLATACPAAPAPNAAVSSSSRSSPSAARIVRVFLGMYGCSSTVTT